MTSFTAWMLRWGDSAALPVSVHPYIYADDMEASFSGIEWLLQNSLYPSYLKKLALDAIKTWGSLEYNAPKDAVADELKQIFSEYGFEETKLSEEFLGANASALRSADDNADIDQNLALLKEALDDEFLRIRFGGLVNTEEDSSELVFRISSVGKDWNKGILSFLSTFDKAKSITVVRDTEPFSNTPMHFYKSRSDSFYNKIPVDDFLVQPGELATKRKTALGRLLESQSFAEIIEKNSNREDLLHLKQILNNQEYQFVKNHPIAMIRK